MNLSSLPYGSSLFEAAVYPYLDKGKFLQLNNIFPMGTPSQILNQKITTYLGWYEHSLVIPLRIPCEFSSSKEFAQYITSSSIDYTPYPFDLAETFWFGEIKGYITNSLGTTLRLYIPKLFSSINNLLPEKTTLSGYTLPISGRGNGIESCYAILPLEKRKESS
jgi:hypothetical protein